MINQRDLALAYSPGVAAPAWKSKRPGNASRYTARGNLVAVVSNGTAVLGLGDIGPLASKPVMEGKACCSRSSPASTCSTSKSTSVTRTSWSTSSPALEPTFGGINLEDIKAPECFYVEKQAARAHEDSRLPRRPARHLHRCRRRSC
jgi:malate dehydrogenase (oxaloacetate-decarboxylating)(NADP+)